MHKDDENSFQIVLKTLMAYWWLKRGDSEELSKITIFIFIKTVLTISPLIIYNGEIWIEI